MAIFQWGPLQQGASNAGEVGKNRDFQPISGFQIDDWWSVNVDSPVVDDT